MMIKKPVIAVMTVAAASAVLLGACSSGASDQAQESNSTSQTETTREAAAKPSQSSTLGGSMAGVTFDHASGVNCQEKRSSRESEQIFECSNIQKSDGLDAIYVKLPGEYYRVGITDYADIDGQVIATQRDSNGDDVRTTKYERVVMFYGDDVSSASRGWSVELGTNWDNPARVTISILKVG